MFQHHMRSYLHAALLAVLALSGASAYAATADIEKKYNQSWKPLLAKGEQVLVSHTKQGYKNMPARGLCDSCTDEDYAALIRFMSAPN